MKEFLIFLVILLAFSCKRKDLEIPEPQGVFVDSCGVQIFLADNQSCSPYLEIVDDQFIESPVFNPKNGDEMLLVHNKKLIKYNLKTHDQVVIYDQPIFGQPSWGKTGWILINTKEGQIWRIDDRTNEKNLVIEEEGFNPIFSITGDTFGFQTTTDKLIRMTTEGLPIDTILLSNFRYFERGSGETWNHSQYIALGGQQVYCFDPENPDDVIQLNSNTELFTKDMIWVGNDLFYASRYWVNPTPGGDPEPYQIYIYKTNINGATTQILESCDVQEYLNPSYSPQRNQIIWQFKHSSFEKESCTRIMKSDFYFMNLDGSGLEKVDVRL